MSNNKTFKEHWDEIAQWFDFNKVHKAMIALEWTWVRCDGTPPIGSLVERARELCKNCYERANQHPSGEGSFTHVYLDPKDGIWYIGYKDGNIWAGAKFLSALCNGSRTQTFSYPTAITDRFEERTQQFWKCTEYFGRRMFNRWY